MGMNQSIGRYEVEKCCMTDLEIAFELLVIPAMDAIFKESCSFCALSPMICPLTIIVIVSAIAQGSHTAAFIARLYYCVVELQ